MRIKMKENKEQSPDPSTPWICLETFRIIMLYYYLEYLTVTKRTYITFPIRKKMKFGF